MKNLFGYLLIIVFAVLAAKFLVAAPKKEARVTQVIKDVRLLTSSSAARAAAVNDRVVEGNAVRTGGDSRTELTFSDQTLTRVGENSVFTFGQGAKEFDLASGAMLLAVPKQNGTTRVNVGAATAAVSGFTALFENNKTINKMVVLEGEGTVSFKGIPDPCQIQSGQMMIWPAHPTTCPQVHTVDVLKVTKTAKLITSFGKLPPWAWDPIQVVIEQQQNEPPPGGYQDPTNPDATDQKNAGPPMPTPPRIIRPPGSPPPSG
jgi:hypothetical protein